MRNIKFIARKEFFHILRDRRSLGIVLLMPVLMTFLYGYAINLDIENIVISIVDYDHSAASLELTREFYESAYFSRPAEAVDAADPLATFRAGVASAILTIKPGLGEALARGEEFELGLLIDGSDASLAAATHAFSNTILLQFLKRRLPPGVSLPVIKLGPQVWYNPDLKSSHFLIPGLVGVIMLMISALLTSVTIAREKETGTMEQLLTAPVRPREILLGKLVPYVVIAFIDGLLVLLFARALFGVPFVGSGLLLLLFGFIFITAALSIGILISSLVRTQQVAMMMAVISTVLPSVMLSGFIFAVKNMPIPLQVISHIIPATFFIRIVRGIMLKGATISLLAVDGLWLVGITVVLLSVATWRFNTRVA